MNDRIEYERVKNLEKSQSRYWELPASCVQVFGYAAKLPDEPYGSTAWVGMEVNLNETVSDEKKRMLNKLCSDLNNSLSSPSMSRKLIHIVINQVITQYINDLK